MVVLLLFSCKSQKQNENAISKSDTIYNTQEILNMINAKDDQLLDTTSTGIYLKTLRIEKLKRDSFNALFDTLYEYQDSIVRVKGLIQSSGLLGTEKFGIQATFQLTNPSKSFFLVTDQDLTKYWGKCVIVYGKYIEGWDYNSGNSREDYAFSRTAIKLKSIDYISSDYCCNSPVFKNPFSYYLRIPPRDTVIECYILRRRRPAPDINYDYTAKLINQINITDRNNVQQLPLFLDIDLDTLNYLIEKEKKVKMVASLMPGHAESTALRCIKYLGYE